MKQLFLLALLGVLLAPQLTFAMPDEALLLLLIDKESGGRHDIKTLDVNNKYSYGLLQFQLHSFMYFGQKYGILPDDLTETEAKLIIFNPKIQKAIARAMIEEGIACTSLGWLNSCKKLKVV